MELEKRERYYIDLLSPSLNSKRPCVTEEERKKSQLKRDQKRRAIDYLCNICQVTCPMDHKSHHNKSKRHLKMVAEQVKAKEETK